PVGHETLVHGDAVAEAARGTLGVEVGDPALGVGRAPEDDRAAAVGRGQHERAGPGVVGRGRGVEDPAVRAVVLVGVGAELAEPGVTEHHWSPKVSLSNRARRSPALASWRRTTSAPR